MIMLTERAWRILEQSERLHDEGWTMDDIAVETDSSIAELMYLSITGPAIRDALERAIRVSAVSG